MALIQREASDPGMHLRCLHVLGSSSTGDNFDQFASNDGLSGSVEQNLVLVDHLAGVLGSIVHGVSSGRDLTGVALSKSPEEGVGKTVFAEVAENGVFNLESREVGGLSNSILGKCLNDDGLVGGGVDEAVVQDLDVGVLLGQKNDLVGDGGGISEGGNVLSDTSEGELDIPGVGSGELSLGLLANDDEVEVLALSLESADVSSQTRVNTTAETLVGRAYDEKLLGLLGLEGHGLGRLVDLVGGLAVLAGFVHGTLSSGQLGGSNNLHGLGDLLDVANGLETSLDLTESRVGGSGVGAGGGSSKGSCSRSSESWSGGP
jgi:hypothetical protein